jgi:membrane protease YdiL (CAAX protease family)
MPLPVIAVVTSLQAFGEELFFRGYVLQALGLATRRRWLLVTVSAVEFAISHMVNERGDGRWVRAYSDSCQPYGTRTHDQRVKRTTLNAFFSISRQRD